MAHQNPGAWTVFERDTPVLTYTYKFGPATSTSLAVGGADGLVVLSPPYRAAEGVYEDLARYGEVRALVASNAFHFMGIPQWKTRFPDAALFAPAQAIERVQKKTKLEGIQPLSAAAAVTGSQLELIDMPHYRTGEALTRFTTSRGLAWYVVDLILNVRELPKNPLLNLLFRVTGSVPGLRWNKVGPTLMVKDKRALRRWIREEFDKAVPRWLIPTHGEILDVVEERKAVRDLLDR